MSSARSSRRRLLAVAVAAALASPFALAQGSSWPSKPVTIVVPFPAGGGTDAFARPLAAALTKSLGRQFIIDNKGGAGGTVGAGRIQGLAVASEKRAPGFPDLPTAAELGLPNYQVATWYGLWAPKGMSKDVVERIRAERRKALNSEELAAAWRGIGSATPELYGEAFGRFVGAELKRWAEVVKASGAKPE